jgi:hypothetical protein
MPMPGAESRMSMPPPEGTQARLSWLEAQAEKAFDALYDARPGSATAGLYSDAKEFLNDAIALARRLGLAEEAERLSRRLDHIKAVFREQFS